MSKKEYLNELKNNLSSLDPEIAKKHVRSFRVKINTLINQGFSEEEAIKKIGTASKVANDIIKGKNKSKKISTKKTVTTKKNSIPKKSNSVKKGTTSEKTSLRDTISIKLDEIKKREKEIDVKNDIISKEKKVSKPKKENGLKNTISIKLEEIKKKKEEAKKLSFESKEEIEFKEDLKLEEPIIINDVKYIEVTESFIKDKPKNIVIKEIINLVGLVIVLIGLYYPVNLLHVYLIKGFTSIGLPMTYVYIISIFLYLFYLMTFICSINYYLNSITNNKKIEKINLISLKANKVFYWIIILPVMLLVVTTMMLFIMSCFLYLDGLRVKGIPVLFFGLLIFMCVLYTTIRNKLLNKQNSIFYSFFIYLIPLLIMGAGLGTIYDDVKDFEFVNNVNSKYTMKTTEYEYDLPDSGEYKISFNTNYDTNVVIRENKKISGVVRVELTYYKDYYDINRSYDKYGTYISLDVPLRRKISTFLENVRENKIFSFEELERYEVVVYINPKDMKKVVIEK